MTEQAQGKIDFGQQVLKEINEPTPEGETHKRSFWSTISIPLLAILTGLIIGAILIAATSQPFGLPLGSRYGRVLGRHSLRLEKPMERFSPVRLPIRLKS